jgi:hypothetical protein
MASLGSLSTTQVFSVSAWDVELKDSIQSDLVITTIDHTETITVDDLEVAQFIYIILKNAKIRKVIDTITSKVVLILGRFTSERKAILSALRDELRSLNCVPVLFDFERPASKDTTGTIETIARMARFIIADLTDPSSIPHELATIVPFLRTTPVLPLRLSGSGGYSMSDDLKSYPWVLAVHEYNGGESLIAELPSVIGPADKMAEGFRRTT